jgi:hypothetical protein
MTSHPGVGRTEQTHLPSFVVSLTVLQKGSSGNVPRSAEEVIQTVVECLQHSKLFYQIENITEKQGTYMLATLDRRRPLVVSTHNVSSALDVTSSIKDNEVHRILAHLLERFTMG